MMTHPHFRQMCVGGFVLVILGFVAAVVQAAPPWTKTEVAYYDYGEPTSPRVDCAIAIDPQGQPHIVFAWVDYQHSLGLVYTWFDGRAWQFEEIDLTADLYRVSNTSIEIDSDGRLHVIYRRSSGNGGRDNALNYAVRDEAGWNVTTLVEGYAGLGDDSLALDSDGRPHIVYIAEGYDGPLIYMWFNGTSWESEVVHDVASGPSLSLDSQGHPHIAFGGGVVNRWSPYYANHDGVEWTIHPNVYDHLLAGPLVLDLDSDDQPHMAQGSWSGHTPIYHSYLADGQWETEVATSNGWLGDLGLKFDSEGRMHLLYQEAFARSKIRHMVKIGPRWYWLPKFSGFGGGEWSMALDQTGSPHIVMIHRLGFNTDDPWQVLHVKNGPVSSGSGQ